eukprot:Gb_28418 [translate_table: standard]
MANLDLDTASIQQREIALAQAMKSDLDYAFELQVQEALAASMGVEPEIPDNHNNNDDRNSDSKASVGVGDDDEMALLLKMQALEIERYQQEVSDRNKATEEMRHLCEEIYRRNYDAKFARAIEGMPDDEWEDDGDNFEQPFEPSKIAKDDRPFKLYYKGLLTCESLGGEDSWESLATSGVVIFDPDDNLVLKLQKTLGTDLSRGVAEYMALIEGLSAASSLGIRNITAYGDSVQIHNQDEFPKAIEKTGILPMAIRSLAFELILRVSLFQQYPDPHKGVHMLHTFPNEEKKREPYRVLSVLKCNQIVTGRWNVRQRKISILLNQVQNQFGKLDKAFVVLLPRCDNRLALKLAREAIDIHLAKKSADHQRGESVKENCSICMEDNDVSQMFEVITCLHRYCVSCMAQHVEVKLRHGNVPACPHEGCNTKLTVDSCKKFLSPKWIDVMTKRLEEALIPESDKVYCPYSNCSALMSKVGIDRTGRACSSSHPHLTAVGCTACQSCNRLFCIECRVPWHTTMSCREYQNRAPQLYGEDAKLHLLAKNNRWRRCIKCKHMIELAEGCYHMTCSFPT